MQIKPLLKFLSKYATISEEESAFLNKIVQLKKFKKKEIIHPQGHVQKYLGFIAVGAVRFFYTDEEGKEDTFEFAFENVIIGQYQTLLSQEKAPASAQAMEDTELLIISKDDFSSFMLKHPRYYSILAAVMGDALSAYINRNKLSKLSSSKERYEQFCEIFEGVYPRIPLTYIASYLNMALGTLSRVRSGKL